MYCDVTTIVIRKEKVLISIIWKDQETVIGDCQVRDDVNPAAGQRLPAHLCTGVCALLVAATFRNNFTFSHTADLTPSSSCCPDGQMLCNVLVGGLDRGILA